MMKKTEIPGYVKDTKSGAIINTNVKEYDQILAAREKRKKDEDLRQQVQNLDASFGEIRGEMQEIKALLLKVLENK